MSTPRLSEEQLVALERVKAGLSAWGDTAAMELLDALLADLRAARAERDESRLQAAEKAWAGLNERCPRDATDEEEDAWWDRTQKAREALAAALEARP